MKIKLVSKRKKLENGIDWENSEVIGICHNFKKESKKLGCAGCNESNDLNLVKHKTNIRLSNTR